MSEVVFVEEEPFDYPEADWARGQAASRNELFEYEEVVNYLEHELNRKEAEDV